MDVSCMRYAYKLGNNPCSVGSFYYCDECGLDLVGSDIGFVAAGSESADGEWSVCPRCGVENLVIRAAD